MRMRVVKRFFKKMAEPIGIVAYVAFAIYLGEVAGKVHGPSAQVAVLTMMLVVPVLVGAVHFTWSLAKREVEDEDKKFLDKLSGNKRF